MLNASFSPQSLEVVRGVISGLDFEPIIVKLIDKKEGKGWSVEKAKEEVDRYKKFLFLNAKYPNRRIVPTLDVDAVWHAHILDTMKYAEDCERMFGCFFHHFPYFGMRGDEDAKALGFAFSETKHFYHLEFGESFGSESPSICDGGGDGDIGDTASICGCDGEITLKKQEGLVGHHLIRPRLSDMNLRT